MNNRSLVVAAGLLALLALLWVAGVLGRGAQRPDQAAVERNNAERNNPERTNAGRTDGKPAPTSDGPARPIEPGTKPVGDPASADAGAWSRLQARLGPCGPVGMGDALCREPLPADRPLEEWARAKYLVLANKNWEMFDPQAWLAQFREVHRRPAESHGPLVEELLALQGDNIELVLENFLTTRDDAAELKKALAGVFDGPTMAEVVVYAIGDGEALHGVLIVGRHRTGDEVTCAYHLWD
jgi:hypothetical protein